MTVHDPDLPSLPGLTRAKQPMRDVGGERYVREARIVDRLADHRRLGALEMLESFASDRKELWSETAAAKLGGLLLGQFGAVGAGAAPESAARRYHHHERRVRGALGRTQRRALRPQYGIGDASER